jgi:hypothetical protein
LANHRQNVRDDSFDEDSPHDLVLPPPPEFEPIEPIDIKPRTPGLAYDDSDLLQIIPKTPGPGLPYDIHDLLYHYEPYDIHGLPYHYEPYYKIEGWNYTEKYTPEPKLNKNQLKDETKSDFLF